MLLLISVLDPCLKSGDSPCAVRAFLSWSARFCNRAQAFPYCDIDRSESDEEAVWVQPGAMPSRVSNPAFTIASSDARSVVATAFAVEVGTAMQADAASATVPRMRNERPNRMADMTHPPMSLALGT